MAGNESLNKTINEQELNKKREEYIEKYLTDAAVENCLSNGFTAASLAWTLLH